MNELAFVIKKGAVMSWLKIACLAAAMLVTKLALAQTDGSPDAGPADAGIILAPATLPSSSIMAPQINTEKTLPSVVVPNKTPPADYVPPKMLMEFDEMKNRFNSLNARYDLLKNDFDRLKLSFAGADERLKKLEAENNQIADVGMALSFGGGGNPPALLKLQADLKNWLALFYYLGKGGGASMNLTLKIRRVRLLVFGFGVMVYGDNKDVLSTRWLRRKTDMVFPFGIDVQVWKNLTAGFHLTMFVANPVAIAQAAAEAGEDTAKSSKVDLNELEVDLEASGSEIVDSSEKVISRAFSDGFKSPRMEFSVTWKF
jgi:hypothetical protein